MLANVPFSTPQPTLFFFRKHAFLQGICFHLTAGKGRINLKKLTNRHSKQQILDKQQSNASTRRALGKINFQFKI